jgi:hypothetical protein
MTNEAALRENVKCGQLKRTWETERARDSSTRNEEYLTNEANLGQVAGIA